MIIAKQEWGDDVKCLVEEVNKKINGLNQRISELEAFQGEYMYIVEAKIDRLIERRTINKEMGF